MAETAKIKSELRALVRDVAVGKTLGALDNPLGIGASTGIGRNKSARSGGVVSPLTEPDYNVREYWTTPINILASDGLFTIVIDPIKKISMQDGEGSDLDFIYADPSA